jgi:hypothetical protein
MADLLYHHTKGHVHSSIPIPNYMAETLHSSTGTRRRTFQSYVFHAIAF